MASVVKVETFDVAVTTTGSTHTLTNDVGATSKAFVKRNTSSDKAGGPTGSTANTNPVDAHCGVDLTGTSTLTFRKGSSTSQRVIGEVWRYTGTAGGADEFIVRSHAAVTITGTSASQAISGISNEDDIIPFITGVSTTASSVNDYDETTFAAHMDGSGNLVVSRGAGTASCTVYVDVVEFTGSNWSVGHGVSSNHDTATETVTLNSDSTGTGGSTFDVGTWANAFMEINMEGDAGGETGISDVIATAYPHESDTDKAYFSIHTDGDSGSRNDATGYIHVAVNPGVVVTRDRIGSISEGNGTYGTVGFPSGTSTSESIDELALEWFSDSTGTGTAHARGRLMARITAASGTIQHWVHRSGNDVDVRRGVINLAGVDNTVRPVITDVEDEQFTVGETNIVITGTNFGSSQGTGKVELTNGPDYATETKVSQSIDSWSNISIQFDHVPGTLDEGNAYVWVTTDAGGRNLAGYLVVFGWPAYNPITATDPDHFWFMQNSNADAVGSNDMGSTVRGTPTFVAKSIYRGATHVLQFDDGGDGTEVPDSQYTNVTNTHASRDVGGWVEVDSYQQLPAAIYEEGGGVNNMYFILGFGNILLWNVADSNNSWKVQAFSDNPLIPNRPYHILGRMSGSGGEAEGSMYIDGVKQSSRVGTITSATMSTHSGDWSFGQPDSSLDTGGTDITYLSVDTLNLAAWGTWSNTGGGSPLTATEIRDDLFRDGAPAKYTLTGGTESAMQTAIEAYDQDDHPDWPCTFRIPTSSSGDFTLTLTDQTFHANCNLHVCYTGADTLTIRNSGTSNVNASKCYAPLGGTISIIETAPITITVKDIGTGSVLENARVYLEADTGGPLTAGTEIVNDTTNASGIVTGEIDYTSSQPVTGRVRSASGASKYKTTAITGSIGASGLSVTVFMISDE